LHNSCWQWLSNEMAQKNFKTPTRKLMQPRAKLTSWEWHLKTWERNWNCKTKKNNNWKSCLRQKGRNRFLGLPKPIFESHKSNETCNRVNRKLIELEELVLPTQQNAKLCCILCSFCFSFNGIFYPSWRGATTPLTIYILKCYY
jgi:hypothetical protein